MRSFHTPLLRRVKDTFTTLLSFQLKSNILSNTNESATLKNKIKEIRISTDFCQRVHHHLACVDPPQNYILRLQISTNDEHVDGHPLITDDDSVALAVIIDRLVVSHQDEGKILSHLAIQTQLIVKSSRLCKE